MVSLLHILWLHRMAQCMIGFHLWLLKTLSKTLVNFWLNLSRCTSVLMLFLSTRVLVFTGMDYANLRTLPIEFIFSYVIFVLVLAASTLKHNKYLLVNIGGYFTQWSSCSTGWTPSIPGYLLLPPDYLLLRSHRLVSLRGLARDGLDTLFVVSCLPSEWRVFFSRPSIRGLLREDLRHSLSRLRALLGRILMRSTFRWCRWICWLGLVWCCFWKLLVGCDGALETHLCTFWVYWSSDLGRISFGVYLLHPTIVVSFGSYLVAHYIGPNSGT